ncbi:MAG: XRE family transcriptional regulator [Spirochaetes bacterium]|nr:XRE family transcriptional regulator [Spirochaetota bacterium]
MKSNVQSVEYNNYLEDLKGYYGNQEREGKGEHYRVGERIKKLREMQGMERSKLARIAGISENYLKDIEDVNVFPDLGTIIRLSKALKTSTGFMLDADSGYSYSVVRKEDRRKIQRAVSGKRDKPEYEYVSLSLGVTSRHMESFIVTLKENQYSNEPSCHDGEEFLYVLEGSLTIKLGNKEETLQEGDSIFYLSTIPHMLKNNSENPAVLLAVVYTG